MEGNLSFDLLHDLMNMSVQHGHGTETLDVRQGLFAVVGSPSPLGIDGPQWNVCKEYDRSAGRPAFEIIFKPLQLFVTERPHASSFQIGDIHQTNEMHALVIEAGPSSALGTFSIALEILLAVVVQHVVLTRYKVDLFRGHAF